MTLTGWTGRVALLGLVTMGLSGCVAVAAIPAIAGGVAVKKAGDYAATTRARKRVSGEQQVRVLPTSTAASPRSGAARINTATALPPPDSTPSPTARAPITQIQPPAATLPADLSAMRPGVAYTGALPSPFAMPTASTADPAPTQRARWTDIGRYVASLPGSPGDSALLARGSTSTCMGPVHRSSCDARPARNRDDAGRRALEVRPRGTAVARRIPDWRSRSCSPAPPRQPRGPTSKLPFAMPGWLNCLI